MPTSIVASNGNSYHLWQLTEYTTPNTEDATEYAFIDNPLLDGYRASIQTGFDAGVKSWKFQMPTLAGYDVLPVLITGPGGESVSREQYVRSVYADNQINGSFVYQENSTNYFVDIIDGTLELQRMRIKIYVTGLTLRQTRIAGVTV